MLTIRANWTGYGRSASAKYHLVDSDGSDPDCQNDWGTLCGAATEGLDVKPRRRPMTLTEFIVKDYGCCKRCQKIAAKRNGGTTEQFKNGAY
jgi:hypothetical protein